MGFWSILLNILIFIVSLGALIVIHELGHLATAKLFKVYCYEFSIGMGPAIYSHKPNKKKGQETAFSVRALPIGGYVSMAGEDLEDAEGVDPSIVVPKDRTIEGKAHYKRIIIMAAGVCMNFLLGYVLLLCNYGLCTQSTALYDSNAVSIVENDPAYVAGLREGDKITAISEEFYYIDSNGNYSSTPDKTIAEVSVDRYGYSDSVTEYTLLNHTLSNLLNRKGVTIYNSDTDSSDVESYVPLETGDKRIIYITYDRDGTVGNTSVESLANYSKASSASFRSTLMFDAIGVSPTYNYYKLSTGDAFKATNSTWSYYCSAIFVGLGNLFTASGWSNVGSIVSIFQISSVAVSSGFASFLSLWAMISINLGIVNLLPFPGLDGWQILVTAIEWVVLQFKKIKGTTLEKRLANGNLTEDEINKIKDDEASKEAKRKKTYDKIKGIVSTVGLVLLIGLSVALIIKDFIFPALG